MSAPLVASLNERFPNAIIAETEFLGETSIEIANNRIKDVLKYLKGIPEPGFEVLMDLTGVDYLEPEAKTKVVYFLHNPSNYKRLRVSTYVFRDGTLPTVTDLWVGGGRLVRKRSFRFFRYQVRRAPRFKTHSYAR